MTLSLHRRKLVMIAQFSEQLTIHNKQKMKDRILHKDSLVNPRLDLGFAITQVQKHKPIE